nr:uncharacterized protein LOC127331759 isoform X2 [Lolium perenne]
MPLYAVAPRLKLTFVHHRAATPPFPSVQEEIRTNRPDNPKNVVTLDQGGAHGGVFTLVGAASASAVVYRCRVRRQCRRGRAGRRKAAARAPPFRHRRQPRPPCQDGGGVRRGGAGRRGRRRRLVDVRPRGAAPGRRQRQGARLPLPDPGPRLPRRRPLLLRRDAPAPGGHLRPNRDGGLPPGARRLPSRTGRRRRDPAPLGRLQRLIAGDRELAMLLLHRGADAGAANPRGTPLHVAAERAHPDVVSVLLRQGADPNKVANGVFTPLVSSLVGGSLKCMKLLILAGANVNAGGFSGATPLFIACSRRGTAPFVKCLLAAGADPNARDELGRLPVEIAAVYAEMEVVELLFPVTRRAPKVPDWTVGGIVSYVNSAAYKKWAIIVASTSKDELKQQGYSAFQRKDYDEAILLYSMALKIDDTDAVLYSNRSVCWLHLGVGDEALSDAQACTRLRPDLAEGYYHQRMAFNLLQDYASASDALLKTSNLDQENIDINDALRY